MVFIEVHEECEYCFLFQIAKDAKECVQECVSEFISFITSEYPFYILLLEQTPTTLSSFA